MRNLRIALISLSALLALAPAAGQQFPTVPDHTVIGRVGTGSSSGPSQAIPFSILDQSILNSLCQTNNAFPVYSSSAATWGCSTAPSANTVFAGPSTGAAAQPTFRSLVGADLPLPGVSSLGGAFSKAAVASFWLRSLGTDGNFTTSQPAFTDISGTVAATQLPNPSATTLGGVKSIASVSHNFLTAISTAGQPSQSQAACADISDAGVGCNAARGQLPGETSTGSASSGNVGEYVTTNVASGSAVSLTSGTAANLASISLTPGDWDVYCNATFNPASTTSITKLLCSISQTSATRDSTTAGAETGTSYSAFVPNNTMSILAGPLRVSLSSTTTIYCVAESFHTVSTDSVYGQCRARRAR